MPSVTPSTGMDGTANGPTRRKSSSYGTALNIGNGVDRWKPPASPCHHLPALAERRVAATAMQLGLEGTGTTAAAGTMTIAAATGVTTTIAVTERGSSRRLVQSAKCFGGSLRPPHALPRRTGLTAVCWWRPGDVANELGRSKRQQAAALQRGATSKCDQQLS